jgi:NTE family protein
VLEREGIRPDLIAGTSVGAIVGGAYAAGHSTDELERRFRELDWFSLVRPSFRLKRSLLDTRRLGKFLRDKLGLTTFEALRVPFAAVVCDLQSGGRVALTRGDVVRAIQASSALPGIFPPEQIDGRMLVDGGVVENLPVRVVREMGADRIIAVDLLPAGQASKPPDKLFEIWHRSVYLMIRANHPDCNEGCHVITPRIAEFSFTDFKEVPELVRRGEEAAAEALASIRRGAKSTGDR